MHAMADVTPRRPVTRRPAKLQEKSQDDLVMATNNSSIVSKRSVERFYYPNEPHYFRFFVRKFQRRAPLINRGYHLRLHVIDTLVRRFLQEPSTDNKIVVNLGCGSDVLPWQCFTRYPENCRNAIFVDVDFPDLILKKRQVVLQTPELRAPLDNVQSSDDGPIRLRSGHYFQIGCDLRDTDTLQHALSSITDLSCARLFFVAEVSVTYMETEAADGVLQWASSIGHAEFCLLEQILPDGPSHPFAKTMIQHFEKLNTPLRSIYKYPTIEKQAERFSSRGWNDVKAMSLWQAWADDFYLTSFDRQRLDEVEPFDEWDELALFASHYLVLHASTIAGSLITASEGAVSLPDIPTTEVSMSYKKYSVPRSPRRFGAPMVIENAVGDSFVAHVMGHGVSSRLRSCDIYSQSGCKLDLAPEINGPVSRMSHALTDLGHYGTLLSGGRASPTSPMRDSWLFNHMSHQWIRMEDLPVPLFRHSVTRLGGSSLALLYGGKSGPCSVSDQCMVYCPGQGWLKCPIVGLVHPLPTFGAILSSSASRTKGAAAFTGILAGGMLRDGTVADQVLTWEVDVTDMKVFGDFPMYIYWTSIDITQQPSIRFRPCKVFSGVMGDAVASRSSIARFGAAWTRYCGCLLILGGVLRHGIVPASHEIFLCTFTESGCEIRTRMCDPRISQQSELPRPLMIGSSVQTLDDKHIILMGGGATCFSMGAFWTPGNYVFAPVLGSLDIQEASSERHCDPVWEFSSTVDFVDGEADTHEPSEQAASKGKVRVLPLQRVKLNHLESFTKVLQAGKPVIINGVDLGMSTQKWSLDYLVNKIGKDKNIVVHESESRSMNFKTKNFRYVTKSFGAFADEVKLGGKLYMRALSTNEPAGKPADLKEDFPSLSAEFTLPPELGFVAENGFSSVLRISGPVNMWLHYDVMANIYCQINGTKRLILFPPADIGHLSFAPGASSSSIDVFESLGSSALAATHPFEATLDPGDILFIPPLWLHTATPVSKVSIAVNVFFRSFDTGYSAGRDVYGNRDLAPYENGRLAVAKMVSAFNKTPAEAKLFYIQRLAGELLSRAQD